MMSELLTVLRRTVKRIASTDGYRWLSAPARYSWYYLRMIVDLKNLPSVLSALNANVREKSPPELIDLVFTGFNGLFRPFHNKRELLRFIEYVASIEPRTIVEIGTARGGSLFLLSYAADANATIVSIDLPAGPYGGGYPAWKSFIFRRFVGKKQTLHLIRGNSHSDATYGKAARLLPNASVDLLFIDGDHSYDGVKSDFLKYRDLVRSGGLIAFHDILDSKNDKDISVSQLWREIKLNYETEEIVDSYDQGQFGLGLLTVPEHWEVRTSSAA